MQQASFQLGEGSFVHRKSGVCLRTRTNIEVLCMDEVRAQAAESRDCLRPVHAWFARARNFRLSLHLFLADDLDLTPVAGRDVKTIITTHLENADLWEQLGYDASLGPSAGHHHRVDFELCSRRHTDSSTLCPDGISSRILRSVQLDLLFAGPSQSTEERERTADEGTHLAPQVPQKHVESSLLPVMGYEELKNSPSPSIPTAGPYGCRVDNFNTLLPRKQKRQKTSSLDEFTFVALLDAGLRSCIAPRPTRLAAGVRCSFEQGMLRLCDIAPTSFTPKYTQKFEDQVKFIPGISRFLTAFLAASGPRASESYMGSAGASSRGSDENGGDCATTEVQKDLWATVASNVQNHEHARRLRPLWSSMIGNKSRKLPETGDSAHHGQPMQDEEDLLCEISDLCLHTHSDHAFVDEEDLFDVTNKFHSHDNAWVRGIPIATSRGDHGRHSVVAVETRDSSPKPADISNPCCEADSSFDSHDIYRRRAGSMSQTSDVSMLLTREEPIDEAAIIRQSGVIGGPRWLSQNVIRTHPPRQREPEVCLAAQSDLNRNGRGLGERTDLAWSEEGLSSERLLESHVLGPQYTTLHDASICSSLVDLHGHDLVPAWRDTSYGSSEPGNWDSTPVSMSVPQDTSFSNAPLADVLGNDHLPWHVWKRRASVTPRGDEDILEMRRMYETDLDIKLFGAGCAIDPSQIDGVLGRGSDEDPMLQDTMENPTLQKKYSQPTPPMSNKRSFSSPPRSPSSSPAVGPHHSESKVQRRSSILKRFSWGVRKPAVEVPDFDMTDSGGRMMEVKRRKTLDDYEMMDMEADNDDSSEMLF